MVVALLAVSPASAQYYNRVLMSYLAAEAMPVKPFKKKALDLHLTPGYATYSAPANGGVQEAKASGFGLGASVDYGLSAHWAIGGLLGYGRMTGDDTSGIPILVDGYMASAMLIGEPLSGDNFRIPVMLGVSYENNSTQATSNGILAPNGASVPINSGQVLYGINGLGTMFGFAPQFNTGPLRWIIFGIGMDVGNHQPGLHITGPEAPSGVAPGSTMDYGGAAAGMTVMYHPLNLSFTYIPASTVAVSANGERDEVYALNWQHRFWLGHNLPKSDEEQESHGRQ